VEEQVTIKAMMLITGSGALVILTSYAEITDRQLLAQLDGKGIHKFIAYEVPVMEPDECPKN